MGVAILSGVIASLDSKPKLNAPKWELHTPGTVTPTGSPDDTTPSRFIACVSRAESVKRLQQAFEGLSKQVEVRAGENVRSVEESDVVLLW